MIKTAKIIFSDIDLTDKQATVSMAKLIEIDSAELVQELTAIGTCDFGHAVITKGYSTNYTNYIFVPVSDLQNPQNRINTELIHQAIRSALKLAKLYEIKDITVELPTMRDEKTIYSLRAWGLSLKRVVKQPLDRERIKEVITSISRDFPGILIDFEYL